MLLVKLTGLFSKQMGGLGISDIGLDGNAQQPDALARHRKISNMINGPRSEGRASPASVRSSEYSGIDSSATAGVLQDAYEPSLLDEPVDTASTVQAHKSERTQPNSSNDRTRGIGTSASNPISPSAQFASQPLPFRQSSEQGTVLQQPPRQPQQRIRDDYGNPQAGAAPGYGASSSTNAPAPKCVPLVPGLLSVMNTEVVNSTIKSVDRGREAVVFHVRVAISKDLPRDDQRHALIANNAPSSWIVEKTWNDLQALDHAVRTKNSRSALRKVPSLPDKHLFKDHAPVRVDQRKVSCSSHSGADHCFL